MIARTRRCIIGIRPYATVGAGEGLWKAVALPLVVCLKFPQIGRISKLGRNARHEMQRARTSNNP